MEVRYDDFAVRRGCSALAVACSPTHAVQVIPNEGVLAIASIYGRLGVFVESDVPRPPTGPNYLDPGVLTERISADLMWTGSEVLVWGGKTQRDGLPNLTDGAAYDPVTGTWRQLATFPVQSTLASRAVWAGDRMIVVSSTGTYGYEPGTDEWELLADGHQPPEWRGRMTVVGDTVYMWNASAINALDLTTGVWSVPGDIFTRWPDSWSGSLHNFDDQVLAVWVPDDRCGGKSFAVWEDNDWQQLPVVSLETATFADCSLANQVAALEEDLVIWDNSSQPTKAYSAIDEEWRGVAWIPLGGTEGPSGSVLMGDRFLVPQWGEGAVYDATSELWAKVDLPGHGTSYDMVWTGEEIIAWGISGTFDAWRWTPPEG